jgi:hypothetical protein
MICKPKMKGGLGTVDFLKKNDALLIKFPHRSYNKDMDVPWVKLVWESYYNIDVHVQLNLVGHIGGRTLVS